MDGDTRLSRREALSGTLTLPFAAGLAMSSGPAAALPLPPDARMLIACFSRSGNTRVIAGQIQRARQADLFEIVPAAPYSSDYEETVRQAERERRAGYEPPLTALVPFITHGGYSPGNSRAVLTEHAPRAPARRLHAPAGSGARDAGAGHALAGKPARHPLAGQRESRRHSPDPALTGYSRHAPEHHLPHDQLH